MSATATSAMLEAALAANKAGICVLPPRQDGSKRPIGDSWTAFQEQRSSVGQIHEWYRDPDRTGLGFVCGKVSGNLELFEFDDYPTYEAFKAAAQATGLAALVNRIEDGHSERSPGGIHWYTRCSEIAGNIELAKRPLAPGPDGKPRHKVLIETRGEGGYAVAYPSHGNVNKDGAYRLLGGGVETIATITPNERRALWDLARTFDEMPPSKKHEPPGDDKSNGTLRPGDDFNARATWREVLEPAGWQLVFDRNGKSYWRRPGKDESWSATTGHAGLDIFYPFTTSSEFESRCAYKKFAAYAILNHGGDYKAAAKALAALGYGESTSPSSAGPGPAPGPATQRSNGHSRNASLPPAIQPDPAVSRGDPAATSGAVPPSGTVLDEVHAFLGRFISYPSENARVAHTLWVAHTHLMDAWECTPRKAFLSPEPASGKTRALEITALLVPRPVEAVNVTPAYLFRKVDDEAGRPTILYDEIDTVFGPKAKENEEIRGLLNAGHRIGAVAGRCVVKGKTVVTEEIPAYCAVALAGLGGLPDTILSRSVITEMRRRAPDEIIEPYRMRMHTPEGHAIRDRLAAWAQSVESRAKGYWPEIPPGVQDRDADLWEPLLTVAELAGGGWPEQARVAAVTLVTHSKAGTPSLGLRLLSDLHSVFGEHDTLTTAEILEKLCGLEEAPWGEVNYGKPLNARGLAQYLASYGVKSKTLRFATATAKGYVRHDFRETWLRYMPNLSYVKAGKEKDGEQASASIPPHEDVTAVTSATCLDCAGPLPADRPLARRCDSCVDVEYAEFERLRAEGIAVEVTQ